MNSYQEETRSLDMTSEYWCDIGFLCANLIPPYFFSDLFGKPCFSSDKRLTQWQKGAIKISSLKVTLAVSGELEKILILGL